MAKGEFSITPDQAEQELDRILAYRLVDRLAFARAHYCMRVLGCPVNDSGKAIVIDGQPGDEARDKWEIYEDVIGLLRDRHDDWLEMQAFE